MQIQPQDGYELQKAALELWNLSLGKVLKENHRDCRLRHLSCNLLALIPARQQDMEMRSTLFKVFCFPFQEENE